MNIQALIATTNQNDHSLLDKMNIQTDAIVGNQCSRNEIEIFDYNNHSVKWLSFAEKGGIKKYDDLKKVKSKLEKILIK